MGTFVIPNDEGGRTTPSVVGFDQTVTDRLQMASTSATNPEQTIYAAKRSSVVKSLMKRSDATEHSSVRYRTT